MAQVQFFISYTGADRAWAEWIAWQLETAGHTTRLQAWDFRPGVDFVHEMEHALREAERLLVVLSPAYRASEFGEAEWRPIFARDPSGELGLLVPVRVQYCEPPELLRARVYVDLVDLPESEAIARLLPAVRREERPGRPTRAPAFPGVATPAAKAGVQPPFPGPGPSISNLAPRNPHFTGREELLAQLEGQLGGVAVVVAVHGLGGVGKTQLVLEYAHRHANQYELIWWVAAESRLLATTGLAEFAPRLGLPAQTDQAEQATAVLAELASRNHWLLIFDNAEDPADLEGLWPAGGGGRVLVTSRNPAWGGHAAKLPINVLAEQEATAFLLARTGNSDQQAAKALAKELRGLPLALEQAAAYLEETGLELGEYLARYRRYHAKLLARGRPTRYPATVATTWQLNLEQLAGNPAAVGLLRLCAFLAPEAIPFSLLAADPQLLPDELKETVQDELILDQAFAALYRFSLLGRDHDGLRLHRLVGEVVRAALDHNDERAWATAAVSLVGAGFPADLEELANWSECARLLPHALTATERAERLEVAEEQTAELLNDIGRYLRRRAEFPAAREAHERGLRLAEATYGPNDPEVASHVNNLGMVLHLLGDLGGAKSHFERAIRIGEAAYDPDHPTVAIRVNNLGRVLRELGDLEGAHTNFKRALKIFEAVDGPNHPNVATSINNLGFVMQEQGDLDGAKGYFERALAIDEATYGPNHPEVAIDVNNLGGVLRDLGDLDGAKGYFERALAIDEATYGPNHPNVASIVNNLGGLLQQQGDLDGAKAHMERALRIDEATYGSAHPEVAIDVNNLGMVLWEQGDLAVAKTHIERALRIFEAAYGLNHPRTRIVADKLARLVESAGGAVDA
jgi:tetratricopeptide (TPR) repeat protein